MKKLTTMFAMVGLTAALALGGCKKKPEERKAEPVTKPTETTPSDQTKPSETTPSDQTKPSDTTKPGETQGMAAELPQECKDYKAAVDALIKCDKLPQASRDALKSSYEQTSATWANITPEQKPALAAACKSATDAVKQASAGCM